MSLDAVPRVCKAREKNGIKSPEENKNTICGVAQCTRQKKITSGEGNRAAMVRVKQAHRKENPVRTEATQIKPTPSAIVGPGDMVTAFEGTPLVCGRVEGATDEIVTSVTVAEGGSVKAAFERLDGEPAEPAAPLGALPAPVAGDVFVAEGGGVVWVVELVVEGVPVLVVL